MERSAGLCGLPDRHIQIKTDEDLRELVRGTIAEIEELVGTELYRDIARAYESAALIRRRHANSPRVAIEDDHRLIALVDRIRTSTDSLDERHRDLDVAALGELLHTVRLFSGRHDDPAWATVRPSLKSSDDYCHTVVTLAAADSLIEHGVDVRLGSEGKTRSADLLVRTGSNIGLRIEVKAPRQLRDPASLALDQCRHLIKKKLHRAGTNASGQLACQDAAILVLRGFGLSNAQLEVLGEAANEVVRGEPEARRHLAYVCLVSLGTLFVDPTRTSQGWQIGPEGHTQATIGYKWIANPNYDGRVPFALNDHPMRVEHELLGEDRVGPSKTLTQIARSRRVA